jgi:hypothetical protein
MAAMCPPSAEVDRSTLCAYERRCGSRVRIGPPRLNAAGTCWQQALTCLTCGARGEVSTRRSTTDDLEITR